jgi:hypothetical protein
VKHAVENVGRNPARGEAGNFDRRGKSRRLHVVRTSLAGETMAETMVMSSREHKSSNGMALEYANYKNRDTRIRFNESALIVWPCL